MSRLLMNWKEEKQGIQLSHNVYDETKQHFEILICFLFLNFENF